MDEQQSQSAPPALLTTLRAQLDLTPSADATQQSNETLLDDLQAASWQIRLAALHQLAIRKAVLSDPELHLLLTDKDASVRAAALYLLGQTPETASIAPIREALDDPDWLVRENALLALGELSIAGRDVPLKLLEDHLDDAQEFVSESAKLALHRASREASIPDRPNILYSFFRLVRQLRPVDISGETEIIEDGLSTDEDAEPIITSLEPGHRLTIRPLIPRLTRVQRLLTGTVAAAVVLSIFATWLLIWPRLTPSQPISLTPGIIFQATDLGSLYQPAWGELDRPGFFFDCSPLASTGTPSPAITVPQAACTPQPMSQSQTAKNEQLLSFVDNWGHLYSWDAQSGKLIKKLTLKPGVFLGSSYSSWSWLYPGRYILSFETVLGPQGTYDVHQKIWDAVQGRLLFTTSGALPFAMTPDGWLATLTPQHTVQIWNTNFPTQDSAHKVTLSSPYFAHLASLSWSPDGSQLATISADGTIQIWEAFNSSELLLQSLHVARAKDAPPLYHVSILWSPGEQRLATNIPTSTASSSIQIWNLQSGHLLQSYSGINDGGMLWLNGGRQMLSNSTNSLRLWDTTTGKTLLTIPLDSTSFLPRDASRQFIVNGQWLILPQASSVQIIDLHTGKVLRTLESANADQRGNFNYLLNAALSPDAIHLATVDEHGSVQVWNIQSGRVERSYKLPTDFSGLIIKYLTGPNETSVQYNNLAGLAWSPDGKMLAATYQGGGLVVLGWPTRH